MDQHLDTNDVRPKVLALHGKQSNSAVTKIQLENLHITSEKYNIFYLDGVIEEERGDPEVEEFVNGPFFSWFYGSTDARYVSSILHAVAHVYKEIAEEGPFDIIFGFSQGAAVATVVGAVYSNIAIAKMVLDSQSANHGQSILKTHHQTKFGNGDLRKEHQKKAHALRLGTLQQK